MDVSYASMLIELLHSQIVSKLNLILKWKSNKLAKMKHESV